VSASKIGEITNRIDNKEREKIDPFLASCLKGRKNRPLRSRSSDLTESSNLLHKVLIFRVYIKSVNESLMQHPATQPTSTGEAQKGLSSF